MNESETFKPVLSGSDLLDFLTRAFPDCPADERLTISEISPGRVTVSLTSVARQLRPGNLIGGPTQMSLADAAMYVLVLEHVGEVAMAVTTSLTMHFLRPARAGELFAEARLLRLGSRSATGEVSLWTDDRSRPCAHAVVAYAIPPVSAL